MRGKGFQLNFFVKVGARAKEMEDQSREGRGIPSLPYPSIVQFLISLKGNSNINALLGGPEQGSNLVTKRPNHFQFWAVFFSTWTHWFWTWTLDFS